MIAKRFLKDAEEEGFTFGDGKKPTMRPENNLYVVNRDWTISHVGWAGHMAFQSAKCIGEKELIRVDYERYLLGKENPVVCCRLLSNTKRCCRFMSDNDRKSRTII